MCDFEKIVRKKIETVLIMNYQYQFLGKQVKWCRVEHYLTLNTNRI